MKGNVKSNIIITQESYTLTTSNFRALSERIRVHKATEGSREDITDGEPPPLNPLAPNLLPRYDLIRDIVACGHGCNGDEKI